MSSSPKPYRFGFVLTTAIGNRIRYLTLRKYAERDPEVDCVWAPVKQYVAVGEPNPFPYLKGRLHSRAMAFYEAQPVFHQLNQLDAVMMHQHDTYNALCLRSLWRSQPLIINSQDDPPVANPNHYPLYEYQIKANWRHFVRFQIDRWAAHRCTALIPFSDWAGDRLIHDCGIPADRIHPIHVGLDLEQWSYRPKPAPDPSLKPKILFVGGDFARKGGYMLLEVFRHQFADRAELHLVTSQPPTDLPANTYLYTDLTPDDRRLADLYAAADLFVLPTTADLSPFACMEAMATGCPVISTQVAGIPEIVRQGETGLLMAPGDQMALAQSIRSLLDNRVKAHQMGHQGRLVIERDFNAAVNTSRILTVMKEQVDRERATHPSRPPRFKRQQVG